MLEKRGTGLVKAGRPTLDLDHGHALDDTESSGPHNFRRGLQATGLPFSSQYKARFEELCAIEELHAIALEDDNGCTGLRRWYVEPDVSDSDIARRVKNRFSIIVKSAVIAAGAPYRINRMD